MAGEIDLSKLLASLAPQLMVGDFVFCTIQDAEYGDFRELSPMASFHEAEGLTLLLTKEDADRAGFNCEFIFKGITLKVHSSLDAVGLTAAVSGKLAERGISANVIAGYCHDYVFVQSEKADAALSALSEFSR
jgi:hypothetical protein